MNSVDTRLEIGITTELGAENAVLETRWVLQIDVELAILSVLCHGNTSSDRCNHRVKDKSEAVMLLAQAHV